MNNQLRKQNAFYKLIEVIQIFDSYDTFTIDGVDFYIDDNYNLVYKIGYENRINVFNLSVGSIENITNKLLEVARNKGYI